MAKLTPEQVQEAVDAYEQYGSYAKAGQALGLSASTVRGRVQRASDFDVSPEEGLVKEEGSGEDEKTLTVNSRVKTLEVALKIAEVDLEVWEVERYIINKWDMGYVPKGAESAEVQDLWQVKIWLKKREVDHVEHAVESLFDRIGTWTPIPEPTFMPITSERHLLEVSLFDAHFGKLAWGPETGTDYDMELASLLYANAIRDLLDLTSGYSIEQILFPIGNDFFHVNSWKNTTVNDTPQDVDSRMAKIFDAGCQAVIRAIEACIAVAPVNVLWVPGNHDPETSYYMAKIVDAWYRNVNAVRVNSTPMMRKYVAYGASLIGFTHGNEEKHADLPLIMARERPEQFAKASSLYWHLGHFHKKKETRHNAGDTFNGVRVQILPSLSGTDAWHYKKGYVKGNRCAEAWLWNFDRGYVGTFNADARK